MSSLKCLLEKNFTFLAIFTHKFNPKSYDLKKNIRSDFNDYEKFCSDNNIPLITIDNVNEKVRLEKFCSEHEFDFLISVSWRYLIPSTIFSKSKIGSFNIHRGSLPKYAGIEPIKQALKNCEKNIEICSHEIIDKIDAGKIFTKISHPVNYNHDYSLDENVHRLKNEIPSHFADLTLKSINILCDNDLE